MSVNNTDIFGRKVFFIAPDSSLVPASFMEGFCNLGYESHILGQGDGSLVENIAVITEHFPEAVIFFNIDAASPGISWLPFIRQLRQQNAGLLVGAVFAAANRERTHHVEAEYGGDVSPLAGCIALSPGDSDGNFKALLSALEKTGAKGRRNSIRARCDESSSISFGTGGSTFHARIDDVNISHLCCILDESGVRGMKIYDKIRGARICVNGMEFMSDIVLIMKRNKGGISTAVFMFIRKPDDEPGLEPELEPQLNKKIYQITSKEFTDLLHK
ncbi:MAG: hypothetical protein K2H09_08470 [Treponemataceae bacterium]|nr:hypothetical protein [Treponemataceae bacterium]